MKKSARAPETSQQFRVAIIMGSDSDFPIMKGAQDALKKLGIASRCQVLSAHRTPAEVAAFAQSARAAGIRVIIAGAGGAAHLPGMVAAYTELPVIGVPVPLAPLNGQDSLLSIVQMPKGVPVATVSIGGAWNAGILAAQMLGAGSGSGAAAGAGGEFDALDAVRDYKDALRREVLAKKLAGQ